MMTYVLCDRSERMMARLNLLKYDIKMAEDPFRELLTDLFHGHYRAFTVDHLLVRPREAIRYRERVRDALANASEESAYDLPDDVILQTLLNLRKSG